MKERMSGIGGNGNDFEGSPDNRSGAAGLNIPKRCEGCPYAEGVTREHAAAVGLEEERKDVVHRCVSALLRHVEHTDKLQKELDLIVDGLWADVKENKRSITKAAQREIDEVTADCPGTAIATAADQSAGFRECNSPALNEGKCTGRYVSFDRYNPEQA
jgi:hypothetical protein